MEKRKKIFAAIIVTYMLISLLYLTLSRQFGIDVIKFSFANTITDNNFNNPISIKNKISSNFQHFNVYRLSSDIYKNISTKVDQTAQDIKLYIEDLLKKEKSYESIHRAG